MFVYHVSYKSLMVEFEMDGGISPHDKLYLQVYNLIIIQKSALLYTTATGERRIRVHNYAIPLSLDPALIQSHADSSVIATYMTKKTLSQVTNIYMNKKALQEPTN